MRLTILGLGSMGRAFATRALTKGHQVTVWNRSPGKDEALRAQGATAAGTVAEAVADAELTLVVLADDDAVRAVCLGPDGALAALGAGGVLANVSTVAPGTVRELAAAGPAGRVLESEVMGAPAAIESGHGRFLLGGPAELAERFAPLWTDLGEHYLHCGEIGSAAVLKLISNQLLITGVTALAEAITTARHQGIPDDLLRTLFADSGVISPSSRLRLDTLLSDDHPGWFTPELARKDLRHALALAADLPLRLTPATEQLLTDTITAAPGAWPDFSAVIEPLRP
jgi:3-hydroxyisobutyrate dehydrogenase-like beta-hydroxyacid dehydrogenase